MPFWIYILKSEKIGRFYIGQTRDVKSRLQKHNEGNVSSTKPYRPWQLVYTEQYLTRADAMNRERYIKSMKSSFFIKDLIAKYSPIQ
jgi:putative endonuclease